MDIATITDVLDYVRKCSKLVNAFIIGIIRQTQADDLTKPIENVENYDFWILKTTRIYKGFATLFLVGVKMLEMKFPKPL